MACLTKEQILAASDLPKTKVDVPEWGTDAYVWVRALTSGEKDKYESTIYEYTKDGVKLNLSNAKAHLVSLCLVNDNGDRLFSEKEADALAAKSAKVVERLYDEARKFNLMDADDIEEAEKN